MLHLSDIESKLNIILAKAAWVKVIYDNALNGIRQEQQEIDMTAILMMTS